VDIQELLANATAAQARTACFTIGAPVVYVLENGRVLQGQDELKPDALQALRRYLTEKRPGELEALDTLGWTQWDEIYNDEIVRLTLSNDHRGSRLVIGRQTERPVSLEQLGLPDLARTIQRPGLVLVAGPGQSGRRAVSHALFALAMKIHPIGATIERGLGIVHAEDGRVVFQYDVGEYGFARHVATYADGIRAAMSSRASVILLDSVDSAADIDEMCRAAEEGKVILLRHFGQTFAHAVQSLARSAATPERLISVLASGIALRAFPRAQGRLMVAEMIPVTERVRGALSKGEVNLQNYTNGITIDAALRQKAALTPEEIDRASVFA
jgi:Tfp pilus assembly pilus retraction ATPase PilT